MITKLRRKFITAAILVVTAVIVIIVGGINVANYTNMVNNSDTVIDVLLSSQTVVQKPPLGERPSRNPTLSIGGVSVETPYSSRYFKVKTDASGKITEVDCSKIVAITEERAIELAKGVIGGNQSSGFVRIYRYKKSVSNGETTYLFLDVSKDIETVTDFAKYSVLFTLIGITAISIFIIFISRVIFKPVQESYEKQKRFITDAGHEFNTPLSIISANAELIGMDLGENEWLDGIENQVAKLSRLTKNLVYVAKMEEGEGSLKMQKICYSDVLVQAIEPFLSIEEGANKKIILEVEPEIYVDGHEDMLNRMITLLMDNAFKHSYGRDIKVTLKKEGKKAVLAIENGCEEIAQGDLSILFERFYRPPKSRGKDAGGSGVGLSVVQTIAEMHKGKAHAFSADGKSIVIKIVI